MTTYDSQKIETSPLYSHFDSHLKLENNNRIFFSSKFGSGKSTFLNEYFDTKTSEYDVFKICPINYSIASNEDVFELIKYDLIIELLLREENGIVKFKKIDFGLGLILHQMFSQGNFNTKLGIAIVELLEKLNKGNDTLSALLATTETGMSIFEKLKNILVSKNIDNKITIQAYLNSIERQTKGINEYNTITQIIRDSLKCIKDKKKVLIVDDLDRMDPEHIFRILNIFSSHQDSSTQNNKFGFDKVILVGDLENIKYIFEHKYGQKTDFDGYMNKFYSVSPYYFNISSILLEKARDLFKSPEEDSDGLVSYFHIITSKLIAYKLLNFRDFISFKPDGYYSKMLTFAGTKVYAEKNELYGLYRYLKTIDHNVVSKIQQLEVQLASSKENEKEFSVKIFHDAIIFLDYHENNVTGNTVIYELDSYRQSFQWTTGYIDSSPYKFLELVPGDSYSTFLNRNIILRTILKALIVVDKHFNV